MNTCETCKFRSDEIKGQAGSVPLYSCRERPPVPNIGGSREASWPLIRLSDACGSHKPRGRASAPRLETKG